MHSQQKNFSGNDEKLEVVIGIFSTPSDASRVAASLRGPDLKLQRVSRVDPTSPSELPSIVYDEIEEVGVDEVSKGAFMGGAIGAGSGLLLLAVPGLNIVGPACRNVGWSVDLAQSAGIDEAQRGIELPNQSDYRSMLAAGKSFVVITGDESLRIDLRPKLLELGAEEIHHHPPTSQIVRKPS